MFHRIEISNIDDKSPVYTEVKIDGKRIKTRSYCIEQEVKGIPVIKLEVLACPSVTKDGRIEITNKDELAALFDKDQLKEFLDVWNRQNSGALDEKVGSALFEADFKESIIE